MSVKCQLKTHFWQFHPKLFISISQIWAQNATGATLVLIKFFFSLLISITKSSLVDDFSVGVGGRGAVCAKRIGHESDSAELGGSDWNHISAKMMFGLRPPKTYPFKKTGFPNHNEKIQTIIIYSFLCQIAPDCTISTLEFQNFP